MFLNLTSPPEAQKGQKKAPNFAEVKAKRWGCTSKTKVDCLHKYVPKMFLNLTPTPKTARKYQKLAPKGQKKCKRGQNVAKF